MKKIFVLTGEPSGDKLASTVIDKLKQNHSDIEYLSVGGSHLNKLGVKSIYDLKEITYIGFTSVILNLFKIRNKINETVKKIIEFNPDILFSVDSPDFTLRVAEKVKSINPNIKTIHYVAPQVWVWREGRVKNFKKFLDHVLLLFNFEKKYFDKESIKNTFVGHPLLENKENVKTNLSNIINENKVIQKIDSLDMNIFSKGGDKIYSITSPNSSYDNIALRFELKKPIINIFNGEKTKYIISSEESTLSDNNKLLKLKGNVKLKTLKNNEDILNADNFIWNIENTNYLLEGNIRFENQNIILNSGKAILGSDNIIEFFKPVKYIIKDENDENKYEINSENAFYNLNTESVSFEAKNKRVKSIIYF